MNDGIKDGVIGDPRICKFDPDELVCKAASSAECLTRLQVNALKKIYAGPLTLEGKQIYADGALMPGAELAFGSFYRSEDFSVLDIDFFRYMAFIPDAGPSWQPTDINFERDSRRFAMMESIYAGNNPDLRKFKARGGKLILYHGWSDAGAGGIPPLKTVDYYETAEKTMGGPEATREFFRLFMIPGMGHCGGGDGAWHLDYLSYLENWVEHGKAPDKMIGAHVQLPADPVQAREKLRFPLDPADVAFTRPVYPYPLRAKYKGTGDPNDAASFEPVEP